MSCLNGNFWGLLCKLLGYRWFLDSAVQNQEDQWTSKPSQVWWPFHSYQMNKTDIFFWRFKIVFLHFKARQELPVLTRGWWNQDAYTVDDTSPGWVWLYLYSEYNFKYLSILQIDKICPADTFLKDERIIYLITAVCTCWFCHHLVCIYSLKKLPGIIAHLSFA